MPSTNPAAEGPRPVPPAAAAAPGAGAELGPALAEPASDLVVELGRERPRPDASGIGLDDAEHEPGGRRAEAGAARGGARDGVGRSDERIGAVVDVEQNALR